ncbi:MAG: MlaD family protein [Bacteroidota bacterium]
MQDSKNTKLGLFVAIGTLLLIAALYFVGTKQNLFGSTFKIAARFHNVNGLMKGNNVRFAGIDVGTIESIDIISDSVVNVVMLVEKKIRPYIKKNAIASVGTDGLMGNKLININSNPLPSSSVVENDVLATINPVGQDEMLRTLNATNENVRVISSNLRMITDKINSKNNLWSLLMDTVVAGNLKTSVVNIKLMSNQALSVTGNLKGITDNIKNGKGSIGALITDTSFASGIHQTIINLQKVSDTAAIITGDISYIVKRLKQGKGSLGILLSDTTLIYHLNKGVLRIDTAAGNLNEDLKAVRSSWPFKKYFKKIKEKNELK